MNDGLTREQILDGVDDRPVEKVLTPEWAIDGTDHVYVRSLSGLEADKIQEFHDTPNMLANYVALLICDKDGNRVFTLDDVETLGGKNSHVLGRICDVGKVFNKLTNEAQEETKKN